MEWEAKKLYVFYDGSCPLCIRSAMWLAAQIKHVPIILMSAQQAQHDTRFAHLGFSNPPEDLVVVTDTGEVLRNDEAFLICLYMLRNYRGWAERLARPALRPLARKAYFYLSRNRLGLSRWIPGAGKLLQSIHRYQDPHCNEQCHAHKKPGEQP